MSVNKMLIDATHPEETRVVVLRDGRVEEFDYESAARKLLRGSIYLAKITRVEPSLQAAFIDYGGNRHGFLAFSEIHPDYYQIPHADKVALLEAERADADDEDDQFDDYDETNEFSAEDNKPRAADEDDTDTSSTHHGSNDERDGANDDTADETDREEDRHDYEANAIDVSGLIPDASDSAGDEQPNKSGSSALTIAEAEEDTLQSATVDEIETAGEAADETVDESHVHITSAADEGGGDEALAASDDDDSISEDDGDDNVESFNVDRDDDDDVIELADENDIDDEQTEARARPRRRRTQRAARPRRRVRHYKIQEVIKRRQIVLIQVVKEERGNKGAALTTYLSLAGRYTVLMPNTARGGGISRKITNAADRKRLKAIAQELEVPEGMGLIIRTAGAARNKQEIKRDFEYLLRLWENVRNLTLESTAPSLVYEEGNLIKRSIRDLYTKEIDEVIVAGERAYKEAKSFMKMLMPSHAKNVVRHEDSQSLFAKHRIEPQLNAMFSPNVQLKSGGYLVINQTEALVAIDVNSGKSTREFSIEETALKTNLEAAEEISRQLKLRDLAGLVVVDFIDMEEKRNNRAVERRLKDCLRADRARIQVGRISHFGLLEMSRQRLRTGVLEGSTMPCAHCQGSGIIRSIESVSLAVLRAIEEALVSGKASSCSVSTAPDVALYLLNQKRTFLQHLEERYGVLVFVRASERHQGANFSIDALQDAGDRVGPRGKDAAINVDTGFEAVAANDDTAEGQNEERSRRRRRRRGGRRDDQAEAGQAREAINDEESPDDNGGDISSGNEGEEPKSAAEEDGRPRRSRRRGRRGGRRHRDRVNANAEGDMSAPGAEQPSVGDIGEEAVGEAATAEPQDKPSAQSDRKSDVEEQAIEEAAEGSSPEPAALGELGSAAYVATQSVDTAVDAAPDDDGDTGEVSLTSQMESVEARPLSNGHAKADVASAEASPDTASAVEVQVADQSEPVDTAEADDSSQSPDDEVADRATRSEPVASEPILQRVVVGPNGAETADEASQDEHIASEEAKKPARRGWWQRPFGG